MSKHVSLDDCLDYVIDNRGVTPHKRNTEWADFGIPVLSANNVKTSGLQKMDEIRYIPNDIYSSWMKKPLEKGDILLTSEAPAGEVMYWDSDEKVIVGQRLYGLKVKKEINSKYLKFYLESQTGQNEIKKHESGSTVFGISAKTFSAIKISLPSRDVQDKIGELLYSIECQIKRNNEMVQKLQVLSQSIYNKWFIQFDYPTSAKKLVYNQELKKKIPMDWKVIKLRDLIRKVAVVSDLKGNIDTIDLSVMPSSSISLVELNSSDNFNTNLNKMYEGNILFGSIRPYLKKCGIAPCNGCVAGTVHQFEEIKEGAFNYALITMSQDFFFDYALKVSKGTRMPVVSADDILDYKLPYNEEIVKMYNKIPISKIIVETNKSTQKLIIIKENLLPLLINGQLE